ncbi:BF3164 family lipoprotein [Algoriphagus terrigena]|uniref:BF3164 family lipoprotein n=1 Tax=Algoriphagus terrigena TaxID=344884 RepID=UPI00041DC37F|nr:BF3164 family lipoprotein [Algoriphagus terrigena]
MKKLYLAAVVILISCSQPNKSSDILELKLSDFQKKENLKGEKIFFDSLLNPRRILLKNDILVISSRESGNLIHLIDKNKLEYLSSKGIQGDGPGEIRSSIWELDRGLNDSTFWAYDLSSKSIHEYALYKQSKYASRTINQKQDWFMSFSNHWISPNEIISNVSRDNYKFGVFDSLGNRVKSFGSWFPEKEIDEKTGHLLLLLNQGPIEFNSKNQTLVHSRIQYELLEISNLKTGKTFGIYGPELYEVKYDIFDSDGLPVANVDIDTPQGYSDVFVGEESIFAIYIGKTPASIKASGESSRTIFEFDLAGNPLSLFELNYPIQSITVDEKEKKIYAITDDREPGIAVFKY